MNKIINIIAPVYNEAEIINDFNESLFKTLNSLESKYTFEVIYVLDKSTDNSLDILIDICRRCPNVRVLALSNRFGHQMSLVAGLDKSNGAAAIMIDSDLEHPPSVIIDLLEKFEQGYDVVHTKRIYNKNIPIFKRFASKMFYKCMSILSTVDINENTADFRLVSSKVLNVMKKDIREQNQFLRGLIHWVGFNQTYVTFFSERRNKGKSKYNLGRMLNFAISGIVSFSRAPLKISIIIGLVISFLSIAYGLFSIMIYFTNSSLPAGWTTLITAISFLGGLQLISIGIIGEYISSIFDEVKKRPLYIIEEEYGFKQNESK